MLSHLQPPPSDPVSSPFLDTRLNAGIEEGEEPTSAVVRELREETGVVSAEIISEEEDRNTENSHKDRQISEAAIKASANNMRKPERQLKLRQLSGREIENEQYVEERVEYQEVVAERVENEQDMEERVEIEQVVADRVANEQAVEERVEIERIGPES
ncbi:hypothetical protein L2E82_48905 [Cichorium intybus]|uniref:Uncharacterized protein n=1 Tax=Cichorium intybus TaxID=13427 RepID=A0ACB8Z024_CICIN|nr:hypothetical protein L2E82_48905 [Cichorium intybus]